MSIMTDEELAEMQKNLGEQPNSGDQPLEENPDNGDQPPAEDKADAIDFDAFWANPKNKESIKKMVEQFGYTPETLPIAQRKSIIRLILAG